MTGWCSGTFDESSVGIDCDAVDGEVAGASGCRVWEAFGQSLVRIVATDPMSSITNTAAPMFRFQECIFDLGKTGASREESDTNGASP